MSKLTLDNPKKYVQNIFMKKNHTAEKEYTFDNDFRLIQSFSYYFPRDYSETVFFNSTKLRRLISNSDSPCISLKTFDENIRLINSRIPNNASENPVFRTYAKFKNQPLHTDIFYRRLPLCLCFDLNGKTLFNKQDTDDSVIKSHEKLNHILGLDTPVPSHIYTFDIHNLNMPPFFAPLFIGIVGSLKKEKSSWRSFRKTALEISEAFYNENHSEINQYLPDKDDSRKNLYTYWLEIHFPDQLFNLLSEFDKIINSGIDLILSHNLNCLAPALSDDIFLTRIKTIDFFQHLKDVLDLFLNTPMINSETLERRNIDIFEEYKKSLQEAHTEEAIHIQELYFRENPSL